MTLALNGLSRVGGAFWGLRYPATMTIYKGVVAGILRYASPAWSKNLSHRQKKRLASIQRTALLRVTRAYRSVSHEAVQVLAGELPIDLLLREESIKHVLKKEGSASLPENLKARIDENPRKWKSIIREDATEEWNRR